MSLELDNISEPNNEDTKPQELDKYGVWIKNSSQDNFTDSFDIPAASAADGFESASFSDLSDFDTDKNYSLNTFKKIFVRKKRQTRYQICRKSPRALSPRTSKTDAFTSATPKLPDALQRRSNSLRIRPSSYKLKDTFTTCLNANRKPVHPNFSYTIQKITVYISWIRLFSIQLRSAGGKL